MPPAAALGPDYRTMAGSMRALHRPTNPATLHRPWGVRPLGGKSTLDWIAIGMRSCNYRNLTPRGHARSSCFCTAQPKPLKICSAISLGLRNGDLFSRVGAFSPGFVIDGPAQGKPSFYISHGTRDQILPIDRCGRRIAGDLKSRGYEVTFREFDGRHEIPKDVMLEGLRWLSVPRANSSFNRVKGILAT